MKLQGGLLRKKGWYKVENIFDFDKVLKRLQQNEESVVQSEEALQDTFSSLVKQEQEIIKMMNDLRLYYTGITFLIIISDGISWEEDVWYNREAERLYERGAKMLSFCRKLRVEAVERRKEIEEIFKMLISREEKKEE